MLHSYENLKNQKEDTKEDLYSEDEWQSSESDDNADTIGRIQDSKIY